MAMLLLLLLLLLLLSSASAASSALSIKRENMLERSSVAATPTCTPHSAQLRRPRLCTTDDAE